MVVKGSCNCGDFTYEFSGEPAAKAACHCHPCQKSAGVPHSYNLMIPDSQFKVTKGISKQWTRKGDSGKDVTYNNCPICSVLLFVEVEAMPGIKILKMGTVDDRAFLDKVGPPQLEIYCKNMFAWEKGIEGAEQKQTA